MTATLLIAICLISCGAIAYLTPISYSALLESELEQQTDALIDRLSAALPRDCDGILAEFERQTGAEMHTYRFFTKASITLLCLSAVALPFLLLSTKVLFVVGPIMLVAMVLFVNAFLSLGFNYVPTDVLLDNSDEMAANGGTGGYRISLLLDTDDPSAAIPPLTDEQIAVVDAALKQWLKKQGYKNLNLNIVSLAHQIGVTRNELSAFFQQELRVTFRSWLSDIRCEAAKQMMVRWPDYSNDIISVECGFSSRSQLYKIFKQKVGITPNEWRKALEEQAGKKGEVTDAPR